MCACVCINMCLWVSVYMCLNMCMSMCMYVYTCVCIHMRVYVGVCVGVSVYMCLWVCMHVHVHMLVYVGVDTCVRWVCTCIHVCACICGCVHVYVHMHVYAYMWVWAYMWKPEENTESLYCSLPYFWIRSLIGQWVPRICLSLPPSTGGRDMTSRPHPDFISYFNVHNYFLWNKQSRNINRSKNVLLNYTYQSKSWWSLQV